MQKREKLWFEKTYLDEQPQLDCITRNWLADLEFDTWDIEIGMLSPIECRSRDGFSAAKHNHGGYERTGFTTLACAAGCGVDYGMNGLVQEQYELGRNSALEGFKHDFKKELESIPNNKINYHDLQELGHPKLAEKLDSYECDWNNEAVWIGVRVMYEGQDKDTKVHTLMVYVGGNISEYYGPFGKGSIDIGEYEIKFKNVFELKKKLNTITKKVEGSFT